MCPVGSVTYVSGRSPKLEKPNNRTGHLVRRKGPSHRLSRHFALIQLLTRFQGALRLVTLPLHRPHFGSDDLRGVVLTQVERKFQGGPAHFVPGVSRIYLQRLAAPVSNTELGHICGVMPADDKDLERMREELEVIGASYVAKPEE